MFSTPVARYSTTSPTPESAYTPPNARPITMNGLTNCQSTPNRLNASTPVIEASGHPDRHLVAQPPPVLSLNFFSQTRVWAIDLSTGAIAKHFSFTTTLPPL